MNRVDEFFGINVFGDAVMKERLPENAYNELKTAISEAVTNAIEHAYPEEKKEEAFVFVSAYIYSDEEDIVKVEIEDTGIGIEDVDTAMLPTYTSKPELEHAGMGFTIMETFMDEILIDSNKDEGTKITLTKKIKK